MSNYKNSPETEPEHGTVAVIHFFSEKTDGVSLQIKENNRALTQEGWDVITCSADATGENGFNIPELDYTTPSVQSLKTEGSEMLQLRHFENQVKILKDSFEALVNQYNPQVIHLRNMLSLPIHPSATVAMAEFIKEHPEIGFLAQHHDAYFEEDFVPNDREQAYKIPNPAIQKRVLESLFPREENVRHAVINTHLQEQLWNRYGIKSTVIPDSFDFETKTKEIPDLREKLGIRQNDLVIGTMARIIPRKGMEVAVQFIAELQKHKNELLGENHGINRRTITSDSRMILLLPQSAGLDEPANAEYFLKIQDYAKDLGVEIMYIGDKVVADSAYEENPDKIPFYSLYNEVDILMFPSYQEGFGNQFLEAAALGKGSILTHIYPVMKSDILPVMQGEGIISLGDNSDYELDKLTGLVHLREDILKQAVKEEIIFLKNPALEENIAHLARQRLQDRFDMRVVGENLSEDITTAKNDISIPA